jgi:hypothetical protein
VQAFRRFNPLRSYFFLSDAPGYPWRVRLTSSNGDPGTNGAAFKNSLRTWNEHDAAGFASGDSAARPVESTLENVIGQLVYVVRFPREILGEQIARRADRMKESLREIFVAEMSAHSVDKLLPELSATLLMHAFVADDRELVRARSDENEHAVSIARLLHSELLELAFRERQRLLLKFAALHKNADLAGGPRFGSRDRACDALVIEPA